MKAAHTKNNITYIVYDVRHRKNIYYNNAGIYRNEEKKKK